MADNTSAGAVNASNSTKTPAGLKDQALEQGNALLHQTKEAAGQAFRSATGQVKDQLATRKDQAADTLNATVQALEATGQQFRERELGFVAGYTDNLTGQVRQLTDYLRDRDIDDLIRDTEAFARRNPSVFIGGAFLLGVALSRFLKSSGNDRNAIVRYRSEENPAYLADTRSFMGNRTEMPDREPGGIAPTEVFGDRPTTAHNYVPGIGTAERTPNL
ncbi:MAG: hypothetical protein SFU56_01085 [Capsulimonadales bacterium]|nr:hypothetical protein [Capsulimonadales bacterium]